MRSFKSVRYRRHIVARQYNITYLYYSNLCFIKNIEFQINVLKNPFNIFFSSIRESHPINFTLATTNSLGWWRQNFWNCTHSHLIKLRDTGKRFSQTYTLLRFSDLDSPKQTHEYHKYQITEKEYGEKRKYCKIKCYPFVLRIFTEEIWIIDIAHTKANQRQFRGIFPNELRFCESKIVLKFYVLKLLKLDSEETWLSRLELMS